MGKSPTKLCVFQLALIEMSRNSSFLSRSSQQRLKGASSSAPDLMQVGQAMSCVQGNAEAS